MVLDQESGPTEEGGVKTSGSSQGLCGTGVIFLSWMADYMGGSLCDNSLGFKLVLYFSLVIIYFKSLLNKFLNEL